MNHDGCDGKHDACVLEVSELHHTMQRRWNIAAEMFLEAHKNQVIKDMYSNLNHLNKLTNQLEYLQGVIAGNGTIRVAYTTQGEPTSAIVRDNYAVIDHKAFQTECRTEEEAHYVTAILNSHQLAYHAKPFCTTNWAKRVSKKVEIGVEVYRRDKGVGRNVGV